MVKKRIENLSNDAPYQSCFNLKKKHRSRHHACTEHIRNKKKIRQNAKVELKIDDSQDFFLYSLTI